MIITSHDVLSVISFSSFFLEFHSFSGPHKKWTERIVVDDDDVVV